MKKFQRIRNLREDHDLSQKKMAEYLHINQRTYSRYETGDSMIPIDVLMQIADFHDVSVDYLLERTDFAKRYPRNKSE